MSTISPGPHLSNKERVKIPRPHMPEQDADRRRANFEEVNQGLTVLGAATEAMRCLQCTSPKCMAGCPVGVKVKDFVDLIVQGNFLGAAAKIREDNILPAITGRVCPQETQCEGCCILGNKFEPLGIGYASDLWPIMSGIRARSVCPRRPLRRARKSRSSVAVRRD
jgi:glutamate synthase (NADPH) small chain